MKNSTNIPAASGAPVRRSDLSEHVLYDLDAVDPFEGCEEDEGPFETHAEYRARREAQVLEAAKSDPDMPF